MMLQWAYQSRGLIAYTTGFMLLALTLVLSQLRMMPLTPQLSKEFVAFLESPEPLIPSEPSVERVTPPAAVAPTLPQVTTPVMSQPRDISVPDETVPLIPASLQAVHNRTPSQDSATVPAIKPEVIAAVENKSSKKNSYEARLLAYLEQIKRYPTTREARQTRPQGAVRVWLEIARNGQLSNVGLLASSGSNLLDNEALRTLRAANYPPLPDDEYLTENTHRFSATLQYLIE